MAALDDMPDCLCFNLRRAARAVTKHYARKVEGGGLRATQTPILTALTVKPSWEMSELAEALGLDRTTLLRNLKPLRRGGLIEAAGASGRRPAGVRITAKGRAARDAVLPSWRRAQREAVAVLGERRWSEILSDLQRVRAALSAG